MTPSAYQIAIESALDEVAAHVGPAGPDTWSIVVEKDHRLDARAILDDGWLLLETIVPFAPPVADAATSEWTLLEWNATLAGGTRFALGDAATDWRVRSEIPLDADVDLTRRLGDVCTGFTAARELLEGRADAGVPVTPDVRAAGSPDAELLMICGETTWGARARGSGVLEVDLDVPGDFHLATIERRANGLVAELGLLDDPGASSGLLSDVRRRALAVLLLRVSGAVRMVRATAPTAPDGPRVRLEVRLSGTPSAAEISHAFGALSVACRIGAREASALAADEALAGAYLRRWDDDGARRARAA